MLEFTTKISPEWEEVEIEPVKKNDGEIEVCPEAEAEFFSVYVRVRQPNNILLAEWVADLPSKEKAEEFVVFLKAMKAFLDAVKTGKM